MKEEVGIKVMIMTVVAYVINSIRDNWQGHGIAYLCFPNPDNFVIKLNGESNSIGWFLYEEIKTLKTLPGVKEALKTAEKISF